LFNRHFFFASCHIYSLYAIRTTPFHIANYIINQVKRIRRLKNEYDPVYKYPAAYARENDELEQYRASTKDQDRLFAMLPFKSLSFSTLKDRKGIFAFIQKDENRDQSLSQRKPSVRKKLQEAQAEPKPPASSKGKEMEL
jgi:hypothetical protein